MPQSHHFGYHPFRPFSKPCISDQHLLDLLTLQWLDYWLLSYVWFSFNTLCLDLSLYVLLAAPIHFRPLVVHGSATGFLKLKTWAASFCPSPSLYLCTSVYFIIHTWMILNVQILIIMKRQNGNRYVWVDMETKPLFCARIIKYYSFISIHFLPFLCPSVTSLAQTSIFSHVQDSCLLFFCILPVLQQSTRCISHIRMVQSLHRLQPSHGLPFITQRLLRQEPRILCCNFFFFFLSSRAWEGATTQKY